MTDAVYEDSVRGYDFAQRLGEDELGARLRSLAEHADTRGDGIPVVVYNGLGWNRDDVATVRISLPAGVTALRAIGPDGAATPVQLACAERNPDGTLLEVEAVFIAKNVPALGYAVYHLVPADADDAVEQAAVDAAALENEHYRLEVDGTGAITRLQVKDGAWEALSAPGNVAAYEQDHGDFWELYKTLNAAMIVNGMDRHAPPADGATFSTAASGAGTLRQGPVFSDYAVAHPFGSGEFSTRIRIYRGVRRVEVHTEILNREEAVRYRVAFPTTLAGGEITGAIPFGASVRPDGVEYPVQGWNDVSAGGRGVALLNRGLPGNNVYEGTLLLSLLRSTRIVSYGYGGGYGPGLSSDSGLELDNTLAFDYALVPHAGDWRDVAVYREADNFNHPLIARSAAPHTGALPARWGLLDISAGNIAVSSLKTGNGKLILRLYEAAGQAVDACVTFTVPVTSAEETNLLDDSGTALPVRHNALTLSFRPFEIKTIALTR